MDVLKHVERQYLSYLIARRLQVNRLLGLAINLRDYSLGDGVNCRRYCSLIAYIVKALGSSPERGLQREVIYIEVTDNRRDFGDKVVVTDQVVACVAVVSRR